MFHEGQPGAGRGQACLHDPLPLGRGATSTHAGGRDGGAKLEGCEVDGWVQPARAATRNGRGERRGVECCRGGLCEEGERVRKLTLIPQDGSKDYMKNNLFCSLGGRDLLEVPRSFLKRLDCLSV